MGDLVLIKLTITFYCNFSDGTEDDFRLAAIIHVAIGNRPHQMTDSIPMQDLTAKLDILAGKVADNTKALGEAITPKKLALQPTRDNLKPSDRLAVFLPATTKKMLYDFDVQLRDRKRNRNEGKEDRRTTEEKKVDEEREQFYKDAVRN